MQRSSCANCTSSRGVLIALSALVSIGLAAAGRAAAADGYPGSGGDVANPISDRFYLRIILYFDKLQTQVRVDPTDTPNGGTTLGGESDLGLPASDRNGRLEMMIRMRERNRMRIDFFQENRSASTQLPRTIIFGDQIFAAGSQVDTTLNWRMMGFTYTHAFLQTDHFELGAGLGVHFIDADAIGNVPATFQHEEHSIAGAWPTLALDSMWVISRRFALTGRGQYFGTTINGFNGSLADYHFDAQYRWKSPFAIGLGYEYMRAKFASSTFGNPGRFSMRSEGPEVFVRISF